MHDVCGSPVRHEPRIRCLGSDRSTRSFGGSRLRGTFPARRWLRRVSRHESGRRNRLSDRFPSLCRPQSDASAAASGSDPTFFSSGRSLRSRGRRLAAHGSLRSPFASEGLAFSALASLGGTSPTPRAPPAPRSPALARRPQDPPFSRRGARFARTRSSKKLDQKGRLTPFGGPTPTLPQPPAPRSPAPARRLRRPTSPGGRLRSPGSRRL